MTADTAAVVVLGAFAGGFVSGLAGFGTGLVALGFWLYVIGPAPAATLVAVCSVASQVQTIPAVWHAIERGRALPMVLCGLIGVPVGTLLLARIDPTLFRLSIGLLLVAFSAFMLVAPHRRPVGWGGAWADGVVGFAGGMLGGATGLSGPLPTAWATLRGWSKDAARGVFQVFNLVVLAAVVISHVVSGLFTAEVGWLVLIAAPGTLIGSQLGVRAYRRLSDRRFRDVVLGLLGVSGLALIWASR